MLGDAHRKTVQHFNLPGHAHLLTFSCYRRMPLLTRDTWRVTLSRSIDAAAQRLHFRLLGFVYMPEHVHLVVLPLSPSYDMSRILSAIKRPFSYRVHQGLKAADDPLLGKLMIRERPGRMVFRFWQEGPGDDRNIEDEQGLLRALHYIHNNPVRRALCPEPRGWPWSSWTFYLNPGLYDGDRLPKVGGFPG